jgi:hypothetical protein
MKNKNKQPIPKPDCVNCEDEIEVAILKLAKEEEPKEQIGFTIEEIEFIKEDERNKIVNSTIRSVLKILRNEGITKEFKEYKEIEKLKKS